LLKDLEVKLWTVGNGPPPWRLEKLANDLGVSSMFKFLGQVADRNPVLRQIQQA